MEEKVSQVLFLMFVRFMFSFPIRTFFVLRKARNSYAFLKI